MTHKIHQGGALEVLKTMPDQSVDCIVTGPPYYGEPLASDDPRAIGNEANPGRYMSRLIPVLVECIRVLKRGGVCYVMLRGGHFAKYLAGVHDWDVWAVRLIYDYEPAREYLMMLIATGERFTNRHGISFPKVRDDKLCRSATMNPEIAEYCIENGSKPGDTILDPFCGTGTTLSVAVSMGRNAIGVEIAPSQIALIEKRMELLDTQVLERR